jgi:dienelactone hydrolase
VTVGGFTCDGIQTATVYYPSDSSKKYPLLSFAHGWTEGGVNVAINYKDVIESVAAAGYVVIAEHSGLELLCYAAEKHDQLHAIDYIKDTPEFADRVDWDSKVGVFGHSMGGASSGLNAADSDAVEKYNLGAAVCLHPAQGGQLAESMLPTFFATGTADTICPPGGVELMYGRAKGPKVFASMKGATHFECQTKEAGLPNPHGWDGYTQHWFNCHIKGMQSDCDAAYDICNGNPETHSPIAKCHVDKGAASMTV